MKNHKPIFTDNQIHVLHTDIDECASNPCQNGGTCADVVNGYDCSCKPGYTGADCETGGPSYKIQHINHFSERVKHKKAKKEIIAYYTYQYHVTSSPDIDECASNPCENRGVCQDIVNRYACTCEAGYTGADCETSMTFFYWWN